MSEQSIDQRILKVLTSVAPDVDPDSVEPGVNFRDQFDFDSMDYLNFVLGLGQEFAVTISETDYPRLSSLEGARAFLEKQRSVTA